MCTAWIDGANGVAHHLAQNLDFAVAGLAVCPSRNAGLRGVVDLLWYRTRSSMQYTLRMNSFMRVVLAVLILAWEENAVDGEVWADVAEGFPNQGNRARMVKRLCSASRKKLEDGFSKSPRRIQWIRSTPRFRKNFGANTISVLVPTVLTMPRGTTSFV